MTSSNSASCTRCGSPIPASAPDQLCPACLMSGALAPRGIDAETEPLSPPESRPKYERTSLPETEEFPRTFGGYRLSSLLGSGGMGAVYEAEQLATGRRLALKMLGQQLDSAEMRQRFLREGRLAASVSHPNSLYVFGTEEIEGCPVITMEIAGGGTLSDKVKKKGPLDVMEAVDATLDIIAGLEAAAALGVLHRDVKPANCFVNPDGSVKVGDFGLSVSTVATAETFNTGAGVIMGTPAYESPEQLRGQELDVRADIYSVGATLFTLLTGKPPIEGSNAVEVVAAALEKKPPSLSELREDVPNGLAHVVARCLAKQPERRYPDYASLRNALLSFSSAQSEPAPVGRRFLAACIDGALIGLIPIALVSVIFANDMDSERMLAERTSAQVACWFGLIISLPLLYYTVLEGIWGASFGKAMMGLRVSRKGGRAPGLGRAFLRAAIGGFTAQLRDIVCLTTMTAAEYAAFGTYTTPLLFVLFLPLVTMRRRNGFATIWDLATGTRVVESPRGAERPRIDVPDHPEVEARADDRIGPYQVVEEIVAGEWIAAYDPGLRRGVWLRRRAGRLTTERRDLARPGRPTAFPTHHRGPRAHTYNSAARPSCVAESCRGFL
jgi:uncharacterized RDD family membrane protein YckC